MDFENLTSEQMARIKACTSPEELRELALSEGHELTDEQLEGIAAGAGWGEPCGGYAGDVRDDIDETQVSEAFMTGELRGDGLD